MKPNSVTDTAPAPLELARPVADSMDQAIGEATTVMGAMVTELMRRSLRGGVMKIGEQLGDYVGERVDRTIAERRPAIEQAAAAAAEETAHLTAAKVAAEEVYALEQRTSEAARALTGRMEEGDQHALQMTRETARELTGQIQEAEKRARATAQAHIGEQVQALQDKAKEGAKVLRSRLKAVVSAAADIRRQLAGEHAALRADVGRQVADLRRENEALRARVAELEKPRGLRRLWAWLFRGAAEIPWQVRGD
jgi:hypothetical protein